MDAAIAQLPLLIGADGVMVPFRPKAGTPKGATRWREVKVALVARIRPRRTKRRHDDPPTETELAHRRLVACLGNIVAFIDELGQRLWLEARHHHGNTSGLDFRWCQRVLASFWRLFCFRCHRHLGFLSCRTERIQSGDDLVRWANQKSAVLVRRCPTPTQTRAVNGTANED